MVIKVIAFPDDICIISQVRHFVKYFCESFLEKFFGRDWKEPPPLNIVLLYNLITD